MKTLLVGNRVQRFKVEHPLGFLGAGAALDRGIFASTRNNRHALKTGYTKPREGQSRLAGAMARVDQIL